MQPQLMYLKAVRAQRERDIAEARKARAVARPARSIRKAVGLSIMQIGARLATEPQPRLARSS